MVSFKKALWVAKFRAKQMDYSEWLAFEQAYELVFQMLGSAKDAALFCAAMPGSDDILALIPAYRAAVVEAASPGGWYDMEEVSGHDWRLVSGHVGAEQTFGVQFDTRSPPR